MITRTAMAPDSLSRTTPSDRPPLRIGLVQHRWRPDVKELTGVLRDGIDPGRR
jgi:N-carbamoylputrescine amidase